MMITHSGPYEFKEQLKQQTEFTKGYSKQYQQNLP